MRIPIHALLNIPLIIPEQTIPVTPEQFRQADLSGLSPNARLKITLPADICVEVITDEQDVIVEVLIPSLLLADRPDIWGANVVLAAALHHSANQTRSRYSWTYDEDEDDLPTDIYPRIDEGIKFKVGSENLMDGREVLDRVEAEIAHVRKGAQVILNAALMALNDE